jgi:hypothetical protein
VNPLDILNGASDKIGDAIRTPLGMGRTKSPYTEKAHFSVERFKTEVLNNGLAEEDRFEVMITAPKCMSGNASNQNELASLMVEQISFPQLSIYVKQLKIFGPSYQRPVMSDYGGDGMSITFLMDRDMKLKKMMDAWMQYIIDQESYLVAYEDDYICQITIKQLDRNNNVVYQCVIESAFPKSLVPMGLSNQAQAQFHRMNVTFAYRKWKVIEPNKAGSADKTAKLKEKIPNVGSLGGFANIGSLGS